MSTRRLLKRAAARVLGRLSPQLEDPVAVLNYHSVGGVAPGSQPIASFRDQVKWLADHAREFCLGSLNAAGRLSSQPGVTRVLLTFDDGYRDNAEIVAPILREFGAHAVFFISSAFVDGDRTVTSAFKNYSSLQGMTWDQVGALIEGGNEIGLHGHRHVSYGRLSEAEAEEDLERAHELIKARTGCACESFAYPFGQPRDQKESLKRVFRKLGLRHVFTTMNRRASARVFLEQSDGRFEIPRIRIDPHDPLPVFIEKVRGYWDWVGTAQSLLGRGRRAY